MTVIGILECGQTPADWIEEHGEMADPFPPFLRRADPSLTFKVYKAHGHQLPASFDECDAWLVTGSPHSVYEHHAWQAGLAGFLAQAAQQRPVVGICYGHQLLHEALGGKVERGACGWGIGVQRYELHEVPAWAPAVEPLDAFRLIALHQDQVTQPAPGTRVLAGNTFCRLCITTIGDNVFTIQAHPEMTRKLARDIYEDQRGKQGDELTRRAVQSLDGDIDDLAAARWILASSRTASITTIALAARA
jgi:GMP synthase-like glutamine amidotransferase